LVDIDGWERRRFDFVGMTMGNFGEKVAVLTSKKGAWQGRLESVGISKWTG
jgi:hypothetical protein